MKTTNKYVIFIDLGGVYFTMANVPVAKQFSKKLCIPKEKIVGALTGPRWTKHAEGRWNETKFWEGVSDELNISREQTRELRTAWYHYPSPIIGMIKLVRKLRKKYKVAVLSSQIEAWVEILERKYRLSKEFHEQHYSFDHGVDKPDAKLFLKAARKMKAKPENCIVVDDNKAFIAAVKKTGGNTILFKNAKQLERDLKKLGVTV